LRRGVGALQLRQYIPSEGSLQLLQNLFEISV
jgi:hypothetical protein